MGSILKLQLLKINENQDIWMTDMQALTYLCSGTVNYVQHN